MLTVACQGNRRTLTLFDIFGGQNDTELVALLGNMSEYQHEIEASSGSLQTEIIVPTVTPYVVVS